LDHYFSIILEIDDLITLKFFNRALVEINKLEGYDYHKYKVNLFMAHTYFEESVSHAIEMLKHSNNLFQKLEYYLIRALIYHKSHFKNRVQKYLKKFEAEIKVLNSPNNIDLMVKYFVLKIELKKKDTDKRNHYIEELFKIASNIVKYQYELILLSYQDEEDIRAKLYPLIKKYDIAIEEINPVNRRLIIQDLLSSLFMTIGDLKNAKIQLNEALDMIGDGMPEIRISLEKKMSDLTDKGKKSESPFLFIDADLTLHSHHGVPKIKYYSVIYERSKFFYIITSKGKTITYPKGDWYVVSEGGRLVDKSDWEREQRHKIKVSHLKRRNKQTFLKANLLEGKVIGSISIGRGEFVTLRGPMGSGKSSIINYLLGIEHPEKGEILLNGNLLGGQESTFSKDIKMALITPGIVILHEYNTKDKTKQINIDENIEKFINGHPREIIAVMDDLMDSITSTKNFFYRCITLFKIKPELILMNEPFANIRGELLEKWLKLFNILAKYHEIAVVLETHHTRSSFHADCQYFIRDHKIVEIIEKTH